MGHNTIDSGMNSPRPSVAETAANSPDDSLHRESGDRTTMELTLAGTAGAKAYRVFEVTGIVEIRRLYGVFKNVSDTVIASTCSWQVYHAAIAGAVITLPSIDCNDAIDGSLIAKTTTDDAVAAFIDAADGGMVEIAGARQGQGFLVVGKSGVTTSIAFLITEGDATEADITHYCEWVAWTPDSSVVAGDGTDLKSV